MSELFIDPFLLTLTLVITIVLILVNMYFVAHYSHHADNGIGNSSATKFVVILSFMMAECQIMMLALDVVNARNETNLDMFVFWQVVYMSTLFWNTIVIPFAYFFYETDEDKDYKTRFCTAFKNEIILLVIFCCIHFPLFVTLRYSEIPVESRSYQIPAAKDGNPPDISNIFLDLDDDRPIENTQQAKAVVKITTSLSFSAYTIGATAFWGMFLALFFIGTGLVSIPFAHMCAWQDRPKVMTAAEFKKAKDVLAKQIDHLLKAGRKIYNQRLQNDKDGPKGMLNIKAWRDKKDQSNKQHEFEANCILIENRFRKLNQAAMYRDRVEPLKYTCHFIMMCITAVVFFIVYSQFWVAGTLRFFEKQYDPFLNDWCEDLHQSKNFSFLGPVLFIMIGYYIFACAVHGNIKFGLRFFTLNFYPMVPQETFLNSFLINSLMLNIYMHSVTYFMCDLFRQYIRGTQASIFFQVLTKNMKFYGWAFQRYVFNTALIVWVFIAFFYFLLKPRETISDPEETKKKDLNYVKNG